MLLDHLLQKLRDEYVEPPTPVCLSVEGMAYGIKLQAYCKLLHSLTLCLCGRSLVRESF